MLAHRTPHAALNTIALNRSTQSAPNRQTNSYANALGAGIAGSGSPDKKESEAAAKMALPGPVYALEIHVLKQARAFGKGFAGTLHGYG